MGTVLNCRLAPGELACALRDARPKVLVYDAEVTSRVLPALEEVAPERETPTPSLIQVAPAGTSPDLPDGAVDFDTALSQADGRAPDRPSNLSTYDEVIRLYTSGTTGLPKGVPLPSFVEVMSAHDVIMHFPLTPQDRTLNMTPWFHRGGLHSGGPNPTFYVGDQWCRCASSTPTPCSTGWAVTKSPSSSAHRRPGASGPRPGEKCA